MLLLIYTFILLPNYILGHGAMVLPHSWFDRDSYVGIEAGEQCTAGCAINNKPGKELCFGNSCDTVKDTFGGHGCACLWFTNYTTIPEGTEPTLKSKFRTYNVEVDTPDETLDWTRRNPWRAPGRAQIYSPCGVAGGNPAGCIGDCPFDAYANGPKAENFLFDHVKPVTQWTRGSTAEAAWGITANHGGGYQYRLCKLPTEGYSALTEECFQQLPLKFSGQKQWIHSEKYPNRGSRREIPAVRTSEGTYPPGSEWTMTPIPSCKNYHGGFYSVRSDCPTGTQFDPPAPGLFGYGYNLYGTEHPFQWSIVDKVEVPSSISPGRYVLSFRWDCEQTPQVWNTCADIDIF